MRKAIKGVCDMKMEEGRGLKVESCYQGWEQGEVAQPRLNIALKCYEKPSTL